MSSAGPMSHRDTETENCFVLYNIHFGSFFISYTDFVHFLIKIYYSTIDMFVGRLEMKLFFIHCKL